MTADKEEKYRERFRRWQKITLVQLSHSIHLILTLSVATLGFETSLLLDGNSRASLVSDLYGFSMVFLLISTGLGSWCTINRLHGFRETTKINKLRRDGITGDKLKKQQDTAKNIDNNTWCIFYCQIGTFFIGIGLLVVSVAPAFYTLLIQPK